MIRWYPVAPNRHEAVHGPYTARMTHEERGWSRMPVYKNGVWQNTISSSPASLRRAFAEIVERWELECDRERLNWLNAQPYIVIRDQDIETVLHRDRERRIDGGDLREATDKAMEAK